MARKVFKHCDICNDIVLVHGEPKRDDKLCPHKSRGREPIEPTVYYVNKEGRRLYPWDSRKLPKAYIDQGYQRVELNGLGEIRRFERDTARQLEAEAQKSDEQLAHEEHERDQRQASLRDDMRRMGEFEREVARLAIEDENRGYSERYDSQFRIEGWN